MPSRYAAGRQLDLTRDRWRPDPDIRVHAGRRIASISSGQDTGRRGEREEADAGVRGGHAPDGDIPRGEAILGRDIPEEQVLIGVLGERAAARRTRWTAAPPRPAGRWAPVSVRQPSGGGGGSTHGPGGRVATAPGGVVGIGCGRGGWLLGGTRRREPPGTPGHDDQTEPGPQGAVRAHAGSRHGPRLGQRDPDGN